MKIAVSDNRIVTFVPKAPEEIGFDHPDYEDAIERLLASGRGKVQLRDGSWADVPEETAEAMREGLDSQVLRFPEKGE